MEARGKGQKSWYTNSIVKSLHYQSGTKGKQNLKFILVVGLKSAFKFDSENDTAEKVMI